VNIIDVIRKNKELLAFGLVFVVLVVVIASVCFSDRSRDTRNSVYVSPLQTNESGSGAWKNVDIDLGQGETGIESLDVYSSTVVSNGRIRSIVEDLGFNTQTEQISDDGVYISWGTDENFARFNTLSGDLVINARPIKLAKIERGYIDMDILGEYARQFINSYLQTDHEVTLTTEEIGSGFDVQGSWLIDGYSVVEPHGQGYSFSISFNKGGDLVALYARMVSFSKGDQTVGLVSVRDVREYIASYTYPKEAYLDISTSSVDTCEDCDPYALYTLEDFENANISEVQIVYYYDLSLSNDVLPVYKLTGTGRVIDEKGKSHNVVITIYANAVDPSKIVIPQNS